MASEDSGILYTALYRFSLEKTCIVHMVVSWFQLYAKMQVWATTVNRTCL